MLNEDIGDTDFQHYAHVLGYNVQSWLHFLVVVRYKLVMICFGTSDLEIGLLLQSVKGWLSAERSSLIPCMVGATREVLAVCVAQSCLSGHYLMALLKEL